MAWNKYRTIEDQPIDYLWARRQGKDFAPNHAKEYSYTEIEQWCKYRDFGDMRDFRDLIVERLVERGYVDDVKFARYYVENRFVKKGVSRKRLKMELMKKGISQDVIDGVLNERSDEEEILKIIAKKRTKYTDEKLVAYLCRQGFSYDLARDLVEKTEG